MKGKGLNRSYVAIFAFFFPFVLFINAQAKTIWQIGVKNESFFNEFISSDLDIIEYEVPPDWKEIQDQQDPNRGGFPAALYSRDDKENNPREIRINFNYSEGYNNPGLVFIVTPKSVDTNNPHYLWLYKGEEVYIGKKHIEDRPFFPYRLPLGYIKMGHHNENRITIRITGPSNKPIVFDTVYLELNDKDSDGDGVMDGDEGDEGACHLDQNTICIPIRSYVPSGTEWISLHIEKSEEAAPYLHDVRFLDQNSLSFPSWLRSGYFFPYGFLGFRINEVASQDKISLLIGYTDALYPSAGFYTYQDTNDWQKVDFEFLDANTVKLFLDDGGAGDLDGERDGNINSILGLSYTRGLDAHIEKGTCFIKTSGLYKNGGVIP